VINPLQPDATRANKEDSMHRAFNSFNPEMVRFKLQHA